MKDIRAGLRALLIGDATILATVGGNPSPRIYPGVLPQGQTQTSIVQNLITEGSDYHMQGGSGLGQARVQIDCWATTQDAAVALANMVFDRLSGHRGTILFGSNSPQDEVVVQGIFHDQGRDDFDSVAKLHTRRRDYLIWYSET
jgi:Protein of unknown function (DUF3168)